MTPPENNRHGHVDVLRAYCGVESGDVPGVLQHGWAAGGWPIDGVTARTPIWAWSDRGVDVMQSVGFLATAIGSPWIYLPPVDGSLPPGTIALPLHWQTQESMLAFASWFRRAHGDGRLLIHPDDVAAVYTPAGPKAAPGGRHRIISAKTGPGFLSSLHAILRQYDTAVTPVLHTLAFYAAFEGLRVIIDGPVPQHTANVDQSDRLIRNPAWVAREFPSGIDRVTAERELGLSYRRSPIDLRRLMGWMS